MNHIRLPFNRRGIKPKLTHKSKKTSKKKKLVPTRDITPKINIIQNGIYKLTFNNVIINY